MKTLFVGFAGLFGFAVSGLALEAVYEVPVTDDLKPYASFVMTAFVGNKGGNEVILYDLPMELTGGQARPIRLEHRQSSKSGMTALYEGLLGEASCMRLTRETLCTINYPKMEIDPQAVESYLKTHYAGDPALPFLLDVAASFGSEPVGILRVKNP